MCSANDSESKERKASPDEQIECSLSIVDLVNSNQTSVRLRNSIRHAARNSMLPYETIGEYLAAGSSAQNAFQIAVRNFGRKTARELDQLVHSSAASTAEKVRSQEEFRAKQAELDERLRDLKLKHMLDMEFPISTRLQSHLRKNFQFAGEGVLDFVRLPRSERERLLALPNFGRSSLKELETLCVKSIIRELLDESTNIEDVLADSRVVLDLRSDKGSAFLLREIRSQMEARVQGRLGLNELLDFGIGSLKEREQVVLRRRYGLGDHQKETLESIGEDFGVTRERVRQIEKKAIGNLARVIRKEVLANALQNAIGSIWRQTGDYVCSSNLYQVAKQLDPFVLLAIDLTGTKLEHLLAESGISFSNGILGPALAANEVSSIAHKIGEKVKGCLFPISFQQLGIHEDQRLVRAAIDLETKYYAFGEYLFRKRPGVRLKRAARSHALLSEMGGLVDLTDFLNDYVSQFPDDICTARDLDIVMDDSPHLFLEIEDGVWTAIGAAGRKSELGASSDNLAEELQSNSDIDEATIAGALVKTLRERGPTSIGVLFNESDTFLPEGRSQNSVGPVLLTRPDCFVRLLPGVYALHEQVPTSKDLLEAEVDYLLNETQAKIFALARRAGERWGTFPAWTPAAEYRLCAWARFNSPAQLFRSLLAIARPNEWPIDERSRLDWARLAERERRFEIDIPARPLSVGQPPDLDRLLAACIATLKRGEMNWLMLNRILRKQVDGLRTRGTLALMIALGIIEAPKSDKVEKTWQLRHAVGPQAHLLTQLLGSELAKNGELSWDGKAGEIVNERLNQASSIDLGWVSLDELMAFMSGSTTDAAAMGIPPTTADESQEDDLEAMLHQHKRSVARRRMEELSNNLLD